MKKKEGFFARMIRTSREDKQRFTESVTKGKDYENLYDIGTSIRNIDTESLMIGASMLIMGLLIWVFTVLVPFLRTFHFRLGTGGMFGIALILCGIAFYIGSFRILHPLSKDVSRAKDKVIRGILAERIVVNRDMEIEVEDDGKGNEEEDNQDCD